MEIGVGYFGGDDFHVLSVAELIVCFSVKLLYSIIYIQ